MSSRQHGGKQPSNPVYYIEDCRISKHTKTVVQTANLTCLASIVMSSMRHGLIASKKAMMGCLPDGMVARATALNANMHTVLWEIFRDIFAI